MNRIIKRIANDNSWAILKHNIINITNLLNEDIKDFKDENDKEKMAKLADNLISIFDDLKKRTTNFRNRL